MLKRKPATVDALAAVDDLYIRRGLGPANAARAEFPRTAPKALDSRAAIRFLREAQKCSSPRDRAVALVPFYAGTRIAEIVGLDVDDVRVSARKGIGRILGKGGKVREIPIHPDLRAALSEWIDEPADWPGADTPALFLNQRTRSPRTSCATPSRHASCAAAPTSSSSPNSSGTPPGNYARLQPAHPARRT